ncbi:MAG TPA: hypothetical protein VNU74_01460 [Terriglobales bacterium]|nr:hypothetical protein [Terriglobales bacterium]
MAEFIVESPWTTALSIEICPQVGGATKYRVRCVCVLAMFGDAALQALMPSRKLTYAATSVKGNIVNTNVYNNWNSLKEAAQTGD